MMPRFRYFPTKTLLAALTLASLLAGCRHDTVVPNPVVDYYPLAVGTYRTYAVSDTLWTRGRATATNYQLREAITEQFTDAAGQPAYRVLRARRARSAAAWADDSVLVVQPQRQSIVLMRNNLRTVELVYPLRGSKTWGKYAFATAREDSVRAFDAQVAQAFTTPAPAAKTYDATATVRDLLPASANDGLYRRGGYLQVFAQGVGPVARRRYAYETFTAANNGAQTLTPGVIQLGFSRLEVLIDSGKL